jgi:glutamate formiminotransferase
VWVSSAALALRVAPRLRSPTVRALGLVVGERAQVSCNLVDPALFGPAQVYDAVDELVGQEGGTVTGAELVGLLPQSVLTAVAGHRWVQLGLCADATIEGRLLS